MLSGRAHLQIGNNENLFDWTYVENAAEAHLLAADRLSNAHPKYKCVAGEAFFITNGEPRPYWDIPRTLWKEAGHVPTKITVIPKGIAMVIAVIMEFIAWARGTEATLTRFRVHYICLTRYCNIDKARNALDYNPSITLDEGVVKSVQVSTYIFYVRWTMSDELMSGSVLGGHSIALFVCVQHALASWLLNKCHLG